MNRFPLILTALCLWCGALAAAELRFLFEFGEPGALAGLVVGPDNALFVTDAEHNAVLKYDTAGRLLASAGGTGNGPGRFDGPAGLTRRSGFDLLVCDSRNHRLVRLNERLDILDHIPLEAAQQDGPFTPLDAASGNDNTLYLCGRDNPDILTLDNSGRIVSLFRAGPLRAGVNLRPVALAVPGPLFVFDAGSGRLLRFDRFGAFLGACAETLTVPGCGLDRLGDSAVAATDAGRARLVLLSPGGRTLASLPFPAPGPFSPGALKIARQRLYVVNTVSRRVAAFRFSYP